MVRTWSLGCFGLVAIFLFSSSSSAQFGSISGRVVESEGSPLPAATVQVRGTGLRVLTDENGNFSMTRVSAGAHVIEIAYVGYATESRDVNVTAGQTASVDVSLAPSAIRLDELQVYGVATRGQAKALQDRRHRP